MSRGEKERGIKAEDGDPAKTKAQDDHKEPKSQLMSVSIVSPRPAGMRCPAKTNAGGPEHLDRVVKHFGNMGGRNSEWWRNLL